MNTSFKDLFCEGATEQSEIDDEILYLGYDTEYTEGVSLTTSQFYIKGRFIRGENRFEGLNDLLAVRIVIDFGTVLVFDDRLLKAGLPYCKVLSQRLKGICNLLDMSYIKQMVLCTFYSNAELSAWFPTADDLIALKHLQGDVGVIETEGYKKFVQELTCIDITGSLSLKGYHLNLPFEVDVIDARHIFSQTDLKSLGKSLKINKLETIDFEKKNANQWLEEDFEMFMDYACIDAVIPLEAICSMHSCKNELYTKLANKKIVPDVIKPSAVKFLNKRFYTTGTIAESLIASVMEAQAVSGKFDKLTSWENTKMAPEARTTKGGLNKVFVKTPTLTRNVDQYDISGAYSTAMRVFKLPLSEPQIMGSHFTTLKELSSKLDREDVEYAIFNMVFKLPEDCSEWDRPLTILNYDNNVGFTGTETDRNQWFTTYEILTLATIHESLAIEIIIGYVWTKERTQEFLSLDALYTEFKTLRVKYKALGESGDAMQNTIKLIGNAGYGKTLQDKTVVDTEMLMTSMLRQGPARREFFKTTVRSKIYLSIWGNAITSSIRSVVALTAWKNKAYMAVTDSIVCDTGTFIHSKDIKTPFNKLNSLLEQIHWECDYTNVHFIILKERDYFSFTLKDEENTSVFTELENHSATEDIIDKMNILKAAKRGFKSSSKDKHSQNIDFATKSIRRMGGQPITFIEKGLIKFSDFLFHRKVLNDTYHTTKRLGSDNIRYLCNTISDLQKHIRIKEKCKLKGYADALDCKNNDLDLYNRIHNTTQAPKKQAVIRTPIFIRYHIFNLIATSYSLRNIELILTYLNIKISKSTLQRWNAEHRRGKAADYYGSGPRVMKTDFSLLNDNYFIDLEDGHSLKSIYTYALRLREPVALNKDLIV